MGTIVISNKCGLCGKRYVYGYRDISELKDLEDLYCPACRETMMEVLK